MRSDGKRTHVTTPYRVAVLLATGLLSAAVVAEPALYTDSAEVVEVAPISKPVRVPVQREVCDTVYMPAADLRAAGNLRLIAPELSLADAISSDLDAFATRVESEQCRWVSEHIDRQEPAGYRVTYQYQGQTYTRIFEQHPGSTIKVQVEVQPES